MKAKQTLKYGVLFRSRLESRWARFLHDAGIDFIYEPKVISKNGVGYAPDFYLPKFDMYIEIKPDKPNAKEIEKAKVCDKPIIFLCAYPECEIMSDLTAGYYNSFICLTDGFTMGIHDIFSGKERVNYRTHSIFRNERKNSNFIHISEAINAYMMLKMNGERAIRTAEIKSKNEEDFLVSEFFKNTSRILRKEMKPAH